MKTEVKGKALIDFEKIINEVYDSGHEDGYKAGMEEALDNEREVEKLNAEYAAAQFVDCITLSDFQDKLKEITNRSYNFMT